MEIGLHAIGERMPAWVEAGFEEYAHRIRGRCKLRLVEVPARKRTRKTALARVVVEEGSLLLKSVPEGHRRIALDRAGREFSTVELARRIEVWLQAGQPVALLVGGPEGLSSAVLEKADECWSLSRLTFAHPLVRVVVAEQLYRAWSILEGLPYHR